jgi:predicted NUDIX family phosphoesterase
MLENVMVVEKDLLSGKNFNGLIFENIDGYLDCICNNYTFLSRKDMETDLNYKQIIPYLVFSCDGKYFLMQRKSDCSEKRLANKMSLGIGGHISKISCEDCVNHAILGASLQCQCCKNKNNFCKTTLRKDSEKFCAKCCKLDNNFQLKSCACSTDKNSQCEFSERNLENKERQLRHCEDCFINKDLESSGKLNFNSKEFKFRSCDFEGEFLDMNNFHQVNCIGDGLNLIFSGAQREFNEEINYNGKISAKIVGLINDESTLVGQAHLGILILLQGDSPDITVKSELKSGKLVSLEECQTHFDNLEPWSQLVFNWLVENSDTSTDKCNGTRQLNL